MCVCVCVKDVISFSVERKRSQKESPLSLGFLFEGFFSFFFLGRRDEKTAKKRRKKKKKKKKKKELSLDDDDDDDDAFEIIFFVVVVENNKKKRTQWSWHVLFAHRFVVARGRHGVFF